MWWWVAFLGCDGGTCTDSCGSPTTDATDTPTDETGTTSVWTGDTAPVAGCAEDPRLHVTGMTVEPGNINTQKAITVTLDRAATVAVRCTMDADPDEVHLLESATPGTEHTLRFSGLLPDSDYTCEAVATCPTLVGAPATTTFTTGPRPGLFPEATVTIDPKLGMTGAFTLMNYRFGGCPGNTDPWAVAYDPLGKIRWWKQLPQGITGDIEVLWHPEDDAIVWGGGYDPAGRPHVSPMWGPDTYASENLPYALSGTFHHDAKRLADGRILSLEEVHNSRGPLQWKGFLVRLHDPVSGRVDLDIDSQRFVDSGDLRTPLDPGIDAYHANAIEYFTEPGGPDRLYVSLCFDRSIISVDPATGDLRWRLAQRSGWEVVGPTGLRLPDSTLPECQHGIDILGDDHLLIYDNGQLRGASQILDLTVDAANQRVTVNWQWDEDPWYEDTLGDVDDLGNGRVLVDRAHPECWSRSPGSRTDVLEIDRATDAIAFRLELPEATDASYRAQRYDGCEFLPGTRFCAETTSRLEELAPLFDTAGR